MIPLFKVFMNNPAAQRGVSKVLESGFIGQGPVVEEFEAALKSTLGTNTVPISTNSCTSAIELVLRELGIGPGDEVITTPLTCTATNAPILAVGARPVWADVDEVGLIDPSDVEQKITDRTKAIIAVDWTGRRADYTRLRSFGPAVIQDAAHGPMDLGTARGHFTCLSFGPIKHLTTGEGGAIITDYVTHSLRLRRWYGLDRTSSKDFRCEQNIQKHGMKWNLTDIGAAIGLENVRWLRTIVTFHRRNAEMLHELITSPYVFMPSFDTWSNYWVFPIRLAGPADRASFRAHMESHGITCSQVHARNDKHRAYRFDNGPLPGLDEFDSSHINIPCGWWVTEEDVKKIADAVNAWRPDR